MAGNKSHRADNRSYSLYFMARQIGNFQIDLNNLYARSSLTQSYLAREISTQQIFIAQLLPRTAFKTPFAQTDLLRTIQNYRHIHSDWVLLPLNLQETSVFLCFISQLCEAGNLSSALEKHGRLSLQETITYMKQICIGMFELVNEGLWHPLLGPQNIFLHGERLILRAVDISAIISKEINEYSAPETVKDNTLDYKSNVWSFGMLLYRMLYGIEIKVASREQLFAILKQPISFPETDPLVIELLRGCLAFDPRQRFGWQEVFSHPVWGGFFHQLMKTRNLAQSKMKFLIRKIKDSVQRNNLNLQLIFQEFGPSTQIPKHKFLIFLRYLDPSLSQWQAEFMFSKFDIDGNGSVSMQELREWLYNHQIKITSLHPPQHVANYMAEDKKMVGQEVPPDVLLKRAMKVVEAIRHHLMKKRINLRSMFSLFEKERAIGYDSFCKMLWLMEPNMSDEDLRASFLLFDWNRDGIIQYEEFEQTLCRVSGFPIYL